MRKGDRRKRGPVTIGEVLGELAAASGFGRVLAMGQWELAWRKVVGRELAGQTQVKLPRRGVLEVTVAHSVLLQELAFRKEELLQQLRQEVPDEPVRDIRFRLGKVDS